MRTCCGSSGGLAWPYTFVVAPATDIDCLLPMPMQLPPVGSRAGRKSQGDGTESRLDAAMQRPACPDRVASLVNRARDLDSRPVDDEGPGSSR